MPTKTQYRRYRWSRVEFPDVEFSGVENRLIRQEHIESGSGRDRFNYCRHYVIDDQYRPAPRTYGTISQWWIHDQGEIAGLNENLNFREDDISMGYPLGLLGRAYEAMLPKIDGDVNVVNFLLELRDFKRMFTSAFQSLELFRKGKVLSAAAEGNLNLSFGVIPFAGDIANLQKSYSALKKKLSDINGGQGKPLLHHYTETTEVPGETLYESGDTRDLRWRHQARKVEWNVTVRYSYVLSIGLLTPTWGNHLKSLGIKPSLKTVWDAIPFSFVVDWMFKVGDWLASFDEKIPINLSIRDVCASKKTTERISMDFLRPRALWANPLQWRTDITEWIVRTKRTYLREKIYPADFASAANLPRLDNISIRELGLSASLLIRKA